MVVKQFVSLFEMEGVKLTFRPEALKAVATKAKEAGTGARALRMILENLMRDLMFEVPSDPTIEEVLIEEECVTKKAPLSLSVVLPKRSPKLSSIGY